MFFWNCIRYFFGFVLLFFVITYSINVPARSQPCIYLFITFTSVEFIEWFLFIIHFYLRYFFLNIALRTVFNSEQLTLTKSNYKFLLNRNWLKNKIFLNSLEKRKKSSKLPRLIFFWVRFFEIINLRSTRSNDSTKTYCQFFTTRSSGIFFFPYHRIYSWIDRHNLNLFY